MTEKPAKKPWKVALDLIVQHRLLILFSILIVLQALTWIAVEKVAWEVDYTQKVITRNSCGGTGTYDNPCRVKIVDR